MDWTGFMLQARDLALRGRGAAAPNPCVGAVLVRGGQTVAEGWHTAYGKPHAEAECLADAARKGVDPRDCALVVTLEPCNHHGKTPPCAEAVLAAGVRRVAVGTPDPNPDVAGGGIQRLRDAGVEVEVGVCAQECRDLIADFLVWKSTDRPYVSLKLAATLDGRIATAAGHSRWVSCPESREEVHQLRAMSHAVLVGGNTFRADDPKLTARPGGAEAERQPLAVVVSTRLPQPHKDYFLLRERPGDTVFWTTEASAAGPVAEALRDKGCRVWGLPPGEGGLDLGPGLARLRAEHGCLYALCEGGGALALSLLRQGRMDELRLYSAPKIVGDPAAPGLFTGLTPETMDQAIGLRLAEVGRLGADARLVYRPLDPETGQGREA
ncbi:MAG: bifunctional diaminohydroxyphosphoribosylaminopyrimidine deaminase/5-amino-6-(5-phosphoribosylamino)uracil reductase RibD [Thermodesulfobacteriota bacterium]